MAQLTESEKNEKQLDALPLPEEMIITAWYFEGDNECKGPYLKVELDLFWKDFSHTREFGDSDDKGLEFARTWVLAYQILKPSLGQNTKEIHRPLVKPKTIEVSADDD